MNPGLRSNGIGLLLCDDLIFTSRVLGTGRDLGLLVRPVRDAATLLALAKNETPVCVIIDLHNPGLAIAELLEELRLNCVPLPFVVSYGSHVETAVLKSAREAGCDLVWPRSKFVDELPLAMKTWFRVVEKMT